MIPLSKVAAFCAAFAVTSVAAAQPQLPPPVKQEEKPEPGIQVLDKGPIHEAFAQPGADVRGKGMTAPKAPPPAIPEVPPDTKPEGANVKWIPGYWMWDANQKDFIWVSGLWRATPPDRDWQAGEWKKAANGEATYTPGFWKPTTMNSWRVDLPEPPKSVENGPTSQPSDPNAVWVPGVWEFRNEQYVWRPGYWAYPNGDQLWQPPQYRLTPYGYSYVPGYWDYPLENRGMLYAPVYFNQPLWQTPGWSYRPRFALGLGFGSGYGYGGLFGSLYIGPGYNNYYYGNGYPYGYGGSWLGLGSPFWSAPFGFGSPLFGLAFYSGYGGYSGYRPWYTCHPGYTNPLWNHYAWLNRTTPGYTQAMQRTYLGQALGVTPPAAPRVISPVQPTVGNAANTALKSAAIATTPRPITSTAPLVQPASQVSRAISANNAARAAAAPASAAMTARPAIQSLNGVTVRPTGTALPSITQQYHAAMQNPPLHYGATNNYSGIAPYSAGSTAIVPRTMGGTTINPGIGIAPRPAVTYSPSVMPQIRQGNPGISSLPAARSIPNYSSGIHSVPAIRPSAPSIGHPGGSIGGGHMGGIGAGHMGGGHAGGKR